MFNPLLILHRSEKRYAQSILSGPLIKFKYLHVLILSVNGRDRFRETF